MRALKIFVLAIALLAAVAFWRAYRSAPAAASADHASEPHDVFGPRPASAPVSPSPLEALRSVIPSPFASRVRELLPDQRIGIPGERARVAAYKERKRTQRDERNARWSAQAGSSFPSGVDEKLRLMGALRAVKIDPRAPSAGAVVKRLGRWEVREREDDAVEEDLRLKSFDPNNPPVVRNEDTRRVGVATGQFVVKYREGNDPRALAATHSLEITGEQENVRRVFLGAPVGRDLTEALVALRADAGVEDAALDVIYDRAVPK